MKRLHRTYIFALLAVLLLMLTLLAACSGTADSPEDTTAGLTEAPNTEAPGTEAPIDGDRIDVGSYALIVSDRADANTQDAAVTLMIAVSEKLSSEFGSSGTDFVTNTAQIDPNACEILIGPTNRPESARVLERLGGALGYVVAKEGNKIVINASATSLLDEAVDYFINSYVVRGEGGAFVVPKELSYVKTDFGGISLLDENGNFVYHVVYDRRCDVTTSETDANDRVDYVILYLQKMYFGDPKNDVKSLAERFDVDEITLRDDLVPAKDDRKEILIGRTNRPETMSFLKTLAINEYGYAVVGNKIVVAGWSDYTTAKAIELFSKDITSYIVNNDGKRDCVLLESDRTVEVYDLWNVDLPLYNAGELDTVVQLLNDSYEAYYVNTTAEQYKAYCADLLTKGYQKHQENKIGANLYGTYYNDTTMIHVYYVDYLKAVRFITESLTTAVLPQNTDPHTKFFETTFTMMGLDDAAGVFGNSFIITLADGSFILHDGGGDLAKKPSSLSRPANNERDELYRLLSALNQRQDGKIVIAAWVISHQHWDHFKNSYDMIMEYYKKDLVVEKMIYNIAAESVKYNSNNPGNYLESGRIDNVKRVTGCDVVVLHSGQTIQIRNLKLEALYTTEDIYPDVITKFNNSSLVHRFTVGTGRDSQRVMIVGDIEEVASKRLVEMYGSELKSDIVQVAHHGYGGSVDLYALFRPSVVLWPKDKNAVNSQLKGSGYYPTINQSLCNQKNVVLIVIADDGHKTIPLPIIGLTSNRDDNQKNFVTVMPRLDGN